MMSGRYKLSIQAEMARSLGERERYRDAYRRTSDPIANDRLLWRAQTFRHCVHLLPGESILELGCGDCTFTSKLLQVSRGENPITAVTFSADGGRPPTVPPNVEYLFGSSFLQAAKARQFDFVIAIDLIDRHNCVALLQMAYDRLKPGGRLLFYESNPWNVVLRLRRLLARLFRGRDPRRLFSRPELYELTSEIGFIRIWTVFNDFVYRPLPDFL